MDVKIRVILFVFFGMSGMEFKVRTEVARHSTRTPYEREKLVEIAMEERKEWLTDSPLPLI